MLTLLTSQLLKCKNRINKEGKEERREGRERQGRKDKGGGEERRQGRVDKRNNSV